MTKVYGANAERLPVRSEQTQPGRRSTSIGIRIVAANIIPAAELLYAAEEAVISIIKSYAAIVKYRICGIKLNDAEYAYNCERRKVEICIGSVMGGRHVHMVAEYGDDGKHSYATVSDVYVVDMKE
jgi:hypothetical protein